MKQTFDHTQDNLAVACGFKEDTLNDEMTRFHEDLTEKVKDFKKVSQVIEILHDVAQKEPLKTALYLWKLQKELIKAEMLKSMLTGRDSK